MAINDDVQPCKFCDRKSHNYPGQRFHNRERYGGSGGDGEIYSI